jgi:hypothetical protein
MSLPATTAAYAAVGSDAGAVPAGVVRLGEVDPRTQVSGQVVLRIRDMPGLERVAREAAIPGSAGYRRPLTGAEVNSRFDPTPATVAALVAHLHAAGLEVSAARGTMVDFRGPAAAVARGLRTSLWRYRDGASGTVFQSPAGTPSLPAAIAGSVLGVYGLDTRPAFHSHLVRAPAATAPPIGPPPAGLLTPAQVKSAYRLASGPLAGTDGTGQAVAILELAIEDQARTTVDLAAYDTQFYGHALTPPQYVTVDTGPQLADAGGQEETDLDLQLVRATAPQAGLAVYLAPNSDSGVNDAYNQMIQDNRSIISTSWGLCEQLQDAENGAETGALRQVFATAAARGITTFAASGDAGAFDCRSSQAPNDTRVAVDSPASDPNVVAVGGMSAALGASTWGARSAWGNAFSSPPQGSGGGISVDNRSPAWQAGPGVLQPSSNGMRQLPDVAVAADPQADAYAVASVDSNGSPQWLGIAGTSAGPPIWAGFTALYRQARPTPVVDLAPYLYSAAQCPLGYTPYDDVTTGNNLLFSAGPGWDLATGWGSLNGGQAASSFTAQDSAPIAISSISPGSGSAAGGTRVTIIGCGFKAGTTVSFGGVAGQSVSVFSPTLLRATTPAHAAGSVDVRVVNPGGASATAPGGFTFSLPRTWAGIGPDGSIHAQQNGTSLGGLGGNLLGAPAVVMTGGGGSTLLIGVGGDHDLWVRSLSQAWRPLSSSPVYCLDNPAGVVLGSTLWVACEGGDRGLWVASTAVGSGLPLVSSGAWSGLGGVLAAGPAVDGVAGSNAPTFAVLGTDNQAYLRTLSLGYSATGWMCKGHPALATSQGTGYFACHGLDGALWYAVNGGGGWSGAASLGGSLVDGPGIAGGSGVTFFAEGGDSSVWQRGVSAGWTPAGDSVRHGVGAAGA